MAAIGWVPVHRQIQENWLWKDKPFSQGQAWIDLLMLANYEDKKTPYKGEVITCERGTVNLSITELAKRWGWSRDKTRRFLSTLESDEMVRVKATKHRTTVTIENYAFYNDVPATNRQPIDNKPTTSRQQADITNNINNINNINNGNNSIGASNDAPSTTKFIKPTLQEVQDYCKERNNSIDVQHFIDHYESNGWKVGKTPMKDWKAAVRTWERRDNKAVKKDVGDRFSVVDNW